MQNWKEMYCMYCGRLVRSTDRFCIFCGGKVQGSAPAQQQNKKPIPEPERKELEKEVKEELKKEGDNVEEEGEETKEGEDNKEKKEDLNKDKKKDEKDSKKKEKEEKKRVQLPDDIKQQLEVKIQLAILDEKKSTIRSKLNELAESLVGDRYENDMDFAEQMNLKVNALKTLKQELDQKEEQLRKELGSTFKMDELEEMVNIKRQQLIELKRSYKYNEVKQDVYDELKEEYTEQYHKARDELQELRENVVIWLSNERTEKARIESQIRMYQARLKAHEITQSTFDEHKATLDKEIEKCNHRIKILESYTKDKKKKF